VFYESFVWLQGACIANKKHHEVNGINMRNIEEHVSVFCTCISTHIRYICKVWYFCYTFIKCFNFFRKTFITISQDVFSDGVVWFYCLDVGFLGDLSFDTHLCTSILLG